MYWWSNMAVENMKTYQSVYLRRRLVSLPVVGDTDITDYKKIKGQWITF